MFNPGDYIHYGTSGLCRVEEIMDETGISRRLSDYGIKDSDLDMLAELGASALVTKNSPVQLSKQDVYDTLLAIL